MSSDTAAIAELSHASHSCLIYDKTTDQIAVTSEFLARGLTRGELCVFLETPTQLDLVRQSMSEAGVDVAGEERRGALLLTSNLDFLDDGHFNGGRTIGFLEEALSKALSQGYSALRATGDMNWELGKDQDFQLLIDYEVQLDNFVRRHPIIGLCQYQRRTIAGSAIRNALETHERIVLGRLLCTNNLYYESPDIRLMAESDHTQNKRAEWMCRRLSRAMMAERQRDSALRSLIQSEQKFKEEMERHLQVAASDPQPTTSH
jgi:hypothetical protein